jgi:hypothetical protein
MIGVQPVTTLVVSAPDEPTGVASAAESDGGSTGARQPANATKPHTASAPKPTRAHLVAR